MALQRSANDKRAAASARWRVYVVRCADGTLYTGVAIDVTRRIAQHNGVLANGARYTRTRRPVKLVYQEKAADRSAACQREHAIKQLGRREKLAMIAKASKPLSLPKSPKSPTSPAMPKPATAAESSQTRRRQNAVARRRAAV